MIVKIIKGDNIKFFDNVHEFDLKNGSAEFKQAILEKNRYYTVDLDNIFRIDINGEQVYKNYDRVK